ncbi:DUF4232 domain-containing protein [Streptomyces roseirectus]|uniref:DUF4232 domain-containing protein n=1 Tax=Streptomyces roseirectus TaxID=2768066 RepID=A0A7H0IGQ2_9ACTN|nr:DUF4232 domain-containing protein [Streptomyces roseirectus]QNP71968.1 DUF4232 domain-containing protein [Streptomyces roseirectus]
MNTARHRTALLTAAGTALVLSLTACQSGTGTRSEPNAGATVAATVAAASPVADAQKADGAGAGGSGSSGSVSSPGKGPAGGAGVSGSTGSAGKQATASTPACTSGDLSVTAAKQDGPPYTHIVLTARNTSRHSCRLLGFPHIQFLESHKQDVPAVAKSKPASPVVLTAGAPAYAAVKLSDGGVDEDNEPVSAFSVTLENDDTVISVAAPGSDGIAVDPAKALTGYWTPELRNGADDF